MRVIATTVVLGHLCGMTTWIAYERPLDGYWINLAICVVVAVFLAGGYQMSQRPDPVRQVLHEQPAVPEPIAERLRREVGDLEE